MVSSSSINSREISGLISFYNDPEGVLLHRGVHVEEGPSIDDIDYRRSQQSRERVSSDSLPRRSPDPQWQIDMPIEMIVVTLERYRDTTGGLEGWERALSCPNNIEIVNSPDGRVVVRDLGTGEWVVVEAVAKKKLTKRQLWVKIRSEKKKCEKEGRVFLPPYIELVVRNLATGLPMERERGISADGLSTTGVDPMLIRRQTSAELEIEFASEAAESDRLVAEITGDTLAESGSGAGVGIGINF